MTDRDSNEIAQLPWGHPLRGRGLRHRDICSGGCNGWGSIFGLADTTLACVWCNGTGLRAEGNRGRAADLWRQLAHQRSGATE